MATLDEILREASVTFGDEEAPRGHWGREEGEIVRGNEAATVLNSAAFRDAYARVYEKWDRAWKRSRVKDADAREHAYMMLFALEAVKAELTTVLETGKLASTTRAMREAEANGSSARNRTRG